MTSEDNTFRRGFFDALPICFGYLAVGFTVAVAAIAGGHPLWSPILLSLTHLSGTSQGAIVGRVSFANPPLPGLGEVILLCMALNLRYLLLSLAVSQRLSSGISPLKRLLVACSITDENCLVALSRRGNLSFCYMMGIFLSSYLGWNIGTALGAFGANLIPPEYTKPLEISLYAMFVAIIAPEAKKSRPVLAAVLLAAFCNVALLSLPEAIRPGKSLSVLVSGALAAIAAAALFNGKGKEAQNGRG